MLRIRWTSVLSRRKTPATTNPTRYAGSTASLLAVDANPPRKNNTRKINFTSGSLTRVAPSLAMMNLVHFGMNHSIADMTATKTSSQMLKSANNVPSAKTVPKSVMKHAARIILPIAVSLNPPSIITAYTTATEVVESAMPAICAWCKDQPKTNCANSQTTTNGAANERTPINTLTRQLALRETGSISAPARNVSTPLPSKARKFVHSVDCSM